MTKVSKGLDLPITGSPEQVVSPARKATLLGVLPGNHRGLNPRLLVEPDQTVALGQPLLVDRKRPQINVVSPASGRVVAVHRGARRALLSIVIEPDEKASDPVAFASYTAKAGDSADGVRSLLLESGLWTALRTRPFTSVPAPDDKPRSIFVTALDTNPLAPRVDVALAGREADFERGLAILKRLTEGPVYLCRAPGSSLGPGSSGATVAEFSGKHPAGTVGFHIHTLDPVARDHSVWHVGAQDVVRIGHLFATGQLDTSVVVALGGPAVKRPRLLRTTLGAHVGSLVEGELEAGDVRVISGSVLNGERCMDDVLGFLGRFHQQVSVLPEATERRFLGWLEPGARAFSVMPAFLSALLPKKSYRFDTDLNGGIRAMVPIGAYERVMPMDLMPTHLLRAIAVGDVEWAEELGVLELDEEDLALCSFVCPGKYDFGSALRRTLDTIEAES